MAKPRKEDIVPDQDYLKEWYEYQKKSPSKKPILLPISVKMATDGLERLRIKSTDMALKQADLMTEFEAHAKNQTESWRVDMARMISKQCWMNTTPSSSLTRYRVPFRPRLSI